MFCTENIQKAWPDGVTSIQRLPNFSTRKNPLPPFGEGNETRPPYGSRSGPAEAGLATWAEFAEFCSEGSSINTLAARLVDARAASMQAIVIDSERKSNLKNAL